MLDIVVAAIAVTAWQMKTPRELTKVTELEARTKMERIVKHGRREGGDMEERR